MSVTVDNESAVWKCHHCEWTGTTLKASTTNFVARPKKVYIAPKTPADPKTPKTMYEYFSDRGISKETVDKKGIYVDNWNNEFKKLLTINNNSYLKIEK